MGARNVNVAPKFPHKFPAPNFVFMHEIFPTG